MTDEQLAAAFEVGTLEAARFTHEAHVRVAWWYLRHHPFADALARFTEALRRFARINGAAEKYHETITVAYMAIIAERLEQSPDLPWPAFAVRHADLLAREPSLLARYYTTATLRSDRARRLFVMPDRCTPSWDIRQRKRSGRRSTAADFRRAKSHAKKSG